MDKDAAPYGLGLLIEITCRYAEYGSTEHHGKFITHVEHKEEQSRHPYGEMHIVFLAGSRDVILYDTLYEEFLQDCADGIEPAHVGRKIKPKPRSFGNLGEKEILNKADDHKYHDK